MRKIKFIVSRCTKKICGYYVIGEYLKEECPRCKNKMIKDKRHTATGFDDEENDDAFIGFQKNGNYKRPKNIKKTK